MNLSPEIINSLLTAALVLGGALLHKFFPGIIPSKNPANPTPAVPEPGKPSPVIDLSGILVDLLRQILARQTLAPQSFGDIVPQPQLPLATSPPSSTSAALYSVTIEGGVVAIRPV